MKQIKKKKKKDFEDQNITFLCRSVVRCLQYLCGVLKIRLQFCPQRTHKQDNKNLNQLCSRALSNARVQLWYLQRPTWQRMLCDGAESTVAAAGMLGTSEASGSPGAGHTVEVTGAAGVGESLCSTDTVDDADAADVSWYSFKKKKKSHWFHRRQKQVDTTKMWHSSAFECEMVEFAAFLVPDIPLAKLLSPFPYMSLISFGCREHWTTKLHSEMTPTQPFPRYDDSNQTAPLVVTFDGLQSPQSYNAPQRQQRKAQNWKDYNTNLVTKDKTQPSV